MLVLFPCPSCLCCNNNPLFKNHQNLTVDSESFHSILCESFGLLSHPLPTPSPRLFHTRIFKESHQNGQEEEVRAEIVNLKKHSKFERSSWIGSDQVRSRERLRIEIRNGSLCRSTMAERRRHSGE